VVYQIFANLPSLYHCSLSVFELEKGAGAAIMSNKLIVANDINAHARVCP
jgi:hypothetical protein